jgi:hypothetical protein
MTLLITVEQTYRINMIEDNCNYTFHFDVGESTIKITAEHNTLFERFICTLATQDIESPFSNLDGMCAFFKNGIRQENGFKYEITRCGINDGLLVKITNKTTMFEITKTFFFSVECVENVELLQRRIAKLEKQVEMLQKRNLVEFDELITETRDEIVEILHKHELKNHDMNDNANDSIYARHDKKIMRIVHKKYFDFDEFDDEDLNYQWTMYRMSGGFQDMTDSNQPIAYPDMLHILDNALHNIVNDYDKFHTNCRFMGYHKMFLHLAENTNFNDFKHENVKKHNDLIQHVRNIIDSSVMNRFAKIFPLPNWHNKHHHNELKKETLDLIKLFVEPIAKFITELDNRYSIEQN